jgi:2-haloacid dehalogenase
LTTYFEQALSIDSLKKIQNQQKPIAGSKSKLVKPEEMLMIAAHGWDLVVTTCWFSDSCFIARRQSLYTLSSKPDFKANDISHGRTIDCCLLNSLSLQIERRLFQLKQTPF